MARALLRRPPFTGARLARGGGKGIGRATALRFLAEGAAVVIAILKPSSPRPSGAATATACRDTKAVLFLLADHRRAGPLRAHAGRLRFSPIVVMETQFLQEIGRGVFTTDNPAEAVAEDSRWVVDDPPLSAIVLHTLDLSWTRDPFDRLITAHALYRDWRLATSDRALIDNLPSHLALPL